MNKIVCLFVIFFILFNPYTPAQAVDPVSAASSAVQQSLSTQNSNRYDPDNPSYFNSLRWLVYTLILFLPFSPPKTLSQASKPSGITTRSGGSPNE